MKKIRKEVELMASIQDCGNVVGLHGVYEDDAQVYVVMELCSGGDLERILEVSNPASCIAGCSLEILRICSRSSRHSVLLQCPLNLLVT